jgi:putative exosortase-associated protein (TIGR04073 family)
MHHSVLKKIAAILLMAILPLNTALAQTAAHKFGRGLAGVTCGFLELPGNIVQESRRMGAAGVPLGLVKGIGMMVSRELIGTYELLSAPFPAPAGFRPILTPEYPWGYFN